MRIAVVGRGVPTLNGNSPGIFEFDQAKALVAAGQDVVYLAVDLRSLRRKRRFGITHGELEGVVWHNISWPVGAVPIGLLCRVGAIAAKCLYRNVFSGREAPDVIHAHFSDIGCIAAYLAEAERIPLVVTEHSSQMNQSTCTPALLRYARHGYETADRVIAVSRALANNIRRLTGVAPIVVPNIVSLEVFLGVERVSHPGFCYAVVANLEPGKRHKALLDAFAIIHRKHADTVLYVVGDGPERAALEAGAKALGLEGAVRFFGYQPREEIARLYAGCDCFVLPSASETFGLAYVEAMAAGLPVIATRCGGPEDFVSEENGLLIDVDDPAQLERAMEQMYAHAGEFDVQAVRKSAERFSPAAVAGELVRVYEGVSAMRRGENVGEEGA